MADRLLLDFPTKILLEDGASAILREDAGLLLNEASAAAATDGILLEDGTGVIDLDYDHALTANGLGVGAPALVTPVLSQVHSLGSAELATTPALATPALTQVHIFGTPAALTTTPALGTPALTMNVALTANGITASPSLATPALSQNHALGSAALTTTPTLAAPAVSQTHALTATGITTTPALAIARADSDARSHGNRHLPRRPRSASRRSRNCTFSPHRGSRQPPVLGTPALSGPGEIAFTADGILAGLPALGAPQLAQIHALIAAGIIAGPALGTPALSGPGGGVDYSLTANPLIVGVPSLGTPVLDPWSWGIGRYPWTALPALSIGLLSSPLSMLPWTALPALEIEMLTSPAEIRVRLVEAPV